MKEREEEVYTTSRPFLRSMEKKDNKTGAIFLLMRMQLIYSISKHLFYKPIYDINSFGFYLIYVKYFGLGTKVK